MDLEQFTLAELRELAKNKGIKNFSKYKKEELIILLNDGILPSKEEDKPEPESTEEELISEDNLNYKLTNEDDKMAEGILEVLPDGYGFLRGENYLSTPNDVYISPVQIRRFKLDTGDRIKGISRKAKEGEKFPSLIFVGEVNGEHPENAYKRKKFDYLIPVYPNERMHLETKPN